MDYYSAPGSCVETVRALHQTIEALRTALEESRNEIITLKTTRKTDVSPTEPIKVSTDHFRPFKTDKQLSTSRIVTFSNSFDGDRQVSSSNTLHIKSSGKKSDRQTSETKRLPKFKEELVDAKSTIICSRSNDTQKSGGEEINLGKAKHLGHVIEAAINKIGENRRKASERKHSKAKKKPDLVDENKEISGSQLKLKSKGKSEPKRVLNETYRVNDTISDNTKDKFDGSKRGPDLKEDTVAQENHTNIENQAPSDTKIEESTPTTDDHKENQQEAEDEISCKGSKKQVEFSVKISKKPAKSISIDIQTKYKKNKHKSSGSKMGDKEERKPKEDNIVPPLDLGNLTDQETCENIEETLANDAEQEVDDIELIFTTDETKETDFKEELVPIDTLLPCPLSDYDEKLSADTSDRELEDDVFNDAYEPTQEANFQRAEVYNSKSDNSIHEEKSLKSYYSFQDSSFENKSLEKDESFDRFEEKVRIVETDISKIGIQDSEYNLGRRNTCPNPLQYRPIMHREALGRSSRKARPIVVHPNVRKDSEAQTNISAVPGSSWRSESSLAHKVKIGDNFTTLPSKFPHPGCRLQLSDKTVEARRILLSDIGFTSMVPELSRSADHLCPPNIARSAVPTSYGQFLRTTDLYSPAYTQNQKYAWTTATPSDKSNSQSRYSSQFISSPPTLTRRCSAPVSPSKRPLRTTTSRVRFANGSLPELRTDWAAIDSGDSTDSLVEEAEHYLRRSIDCLAPCRNVCFKSDSSKTIRRASAPEPCRDNVPPQGWQPFLPRMPRDLHLDFWVKVITAEGRVRGGRVRYVGPLLNQSESYVGVQLSTPDGQSDGTYNNRRYFNCEPYHGLFIPFKKIIMGWRP